MHLRSDDADESLGYLRGGFTFPSPPWEAVKHGWPVARPSVEVPIAKAIQVAPPGISLVALIGGGGEGKSTVLRRVAWETAKRLSEYVVLWTDEYLGREKAAFPHAWIDSLRSGSRVLLCADGAARLHEVGALIAAHRRYVQDNKTVLVLVADRAVGWNGSALRRLSNRVGGMSKLVISLTPLTAEELRELGNRYVERGILTMAVATKRLSAIVQSSQRKGDQAWLLPTVMQLTDPEERSFAAILQSVLDGLSESGESGAHRLLLTTSLAHAAGSGLPTRTAADLLRPYAGLARALAALTDELDKQRLGYRRGLRDAIAEKLWTHHQIVARGLVDVAHSSVTDQPHLVEICSELPLAFEGDYDNNALLPASIFDLLDRIVDYLYDSKYFRECESLLAAWVALDPTSFPALHRLGECYGEEVRSLIDGGSADRDELRQLAQSARNALRDSVATARLVLGDADLRPLPYASYSLAEQEQISALAQAAMEGKLSNAFSGEEKTSLLLRTAFLSLQAISPGPRRSGDNRSLIRACGLLALALIQLGKTDLASRMVAAELWLTGQVGPIIGRQRSELEQMGVSIPPASLTWLDDVLSRLSTGLLLKTWDKIGLFESAEAHRKAIVEALGQLQTWLPDAPRIRKARERLAGTVAENP
jgi:hypothetical protein